MLPHPGYLCPGLEFLLLKNPQLDRDKPLLIDGSLLASGLNRLPMALCKRLIVYVSVGYYNPTSNARELAEAGQQYELAVILCPVESDFLGSAGSTAAGFNCNIFYRRSRPGDW